MQTAKLAELSEVLTYPARVVPKVNAAVLSEIDGVVTRIGSTVYDGSIRRQLQKIREQLNESV